MIESIGFPKAHLAVSGLRMFGLGQGKVPGKVKNLAVHRRADRTDLKSTLSIPPNHSFPLQLSSGF
jgi:hypothetical protein